jgi:rubrerythrin
MALSHDAAWAKQADEAIKRRVEKNTPWYQHTCQGCGKKYSSDTNYAVCPSCVKQAYDVIG